MSSLHDIRTGIQRARAEMLSELIREALIVGADAAALVENRVVSRGENAEGGRLSPYSTKAVGAWRYLGRSRNAAGEAAVRKRAKAKQELSYKDFRSLNGLETDRKNLQFTGEMWQGFGVTGVRIVSAGVVEVTIGGKNNRTERLLGYHSEREGTNISAASRQELAAVEAGIVERLTKIIKRNV